jgi:DNA-binding LacI/PurR family transcriptional regulator
MRAHGGFDFRLRTGPFEALTAIAQPTYELGRTAMEHLLARMRADPEHADPDQRILLPAEFRVRQSTAPPRSSGRAVGR